RAIQQLVEVEPEGLPLSRDDVRRPVRGWSFVSDDALTAHGPILIHPALVVAGRVSAPIGHLAQSGSRPHERAADGPIAKLLIDPEHRTVGLVVLREDEFDPTLGSVH